MAAVIFDPAKFKTAFPEFADVPDARLTLLFNLAAAGLLDNTDASPVTNIDQRESMLFYIVAHLLALTGTGVAGAANGGTAPLGRMSSATEGSVSVSYEFNVPTSPGAAWWNLTQYGALYWMLMAPFRSFRYVANGRSGIGHAIDYRYPNRFGYPLAGDPNSGTPGGA